MPTNVVEFDGVCYASAFYVQGSRLVVLGTHRSDRAGVRGWLAAAGYPRFGAYLTPARGTAPGFYAKPYDADVYYRIDPTTGAADRDGQTRFGDPRPVTEGDGFRGAARAATVGVLGSLSRSLPLRGRAVMRYTGVVLVVMAAAIATFAASGFMATHPDGLAATSFMLAVASGSAVAGAAVLAFGGSGYSRANDAPSPAG